MKAYVDGKKIYYEVHGSGEPLILVAGMISDTTFWSYVIEDLAKHFQVIIYDHTGIGRSSSSKVSYSIEQMSKDTLSLMNYLKIEKVNIVGHSLGAAIVQWIAFNYPERVNHIVLSSPLIKASAGLIYLFKSAAKLIRWWSSRKAVIEMTLYWTFSKEFLKKQEAVEKYIMRQLESSNKITIKAFYGHLDASRSFDSSEWYQEIKNPTLFIIGEEDRIFFEQENEKFAEKMPQAKIVIMKDVGHMAPLEKPQEFSNLVIDFLKT